MPILGPGNGTATTTRSSGCLDPTDHGDGRLVAVDPFTSLRYHFGMLLGVEDFETEHSYHQGKMRLHNAWLHRAGVVWGMGVSFDAETGELQVRPGLALDGAGRELHLNCVACLDIGAWYALHNNDEGFEFERDDARVRFDAQVAIRLGTCLSRQVPALADPCDGATATTAYSRVIETVDIRLRAHEPRKADPYHRLRLLFDLDDADASSDAEVVDRREWILGQPLDRQPREYLRAFREFAALDEIDLAPQTTVDDEPATIFPEDDATEVLLADIDDIVLKRSKGGWVIAQPLPTVDVRVRPSHVGTATIQELLNGPRFSSPPPPDEKPRDGADGDDQPDGDPGQRPPTEGNGPDKDDKPGGDARQQAGGDPRQQGGEYPPQTAADDVAPRLRFVRRKDRRITLSSTHPLQPASVQPPAFVVAAFHPDGGWRDLDILEAGVDKRRTRITIELRETEPHGATGLRVFAYGTGTHPLLGLDMLPIAGAVGGPPVPSGSGGDFAHMLNLEG